MKKLILFILILLLVSCNGKGTDKSAVPSIAPSSGGDSIEPSTIPHKYEGGVSSISSPSYMYVVWEDQKWLYVPDTNNVLSWQVITTMPGSAYVSGDFVGTDYTKMYAIAYFFSSLDTIDVATGKTTRIGKLQMYTPTGGWTGLAGTKSGILYAVSVDGFSSYLYVVNTKNAVTLFVGKICDDCTIIDIAVKDNYIMYGVDIHSNMLFSINPISGKGFPIGDLGFDPNYSQDMDYNNNTQTLYLASYNNTTSCGELRVANTNTGMTTLITPFPNCDEVSAFSFINDDVVFLKNYLVPIFKDSK